VLRNEVNRGKGFSVRRGMLEASGELRLLCDADCAASLVSLDRMIEAMEHSDVAIGSRIAPGADVGRTQPLARRLVGWPFIALTRLLLSEPTRDIYCGFKLWRAAADGFAYGHAYEQARSRWRLAEALLAADDRAAAAEELRAAAEVAVRLGAAPLRSAVTALARRGRLDLPGVGRVPDAAAVLTPREAEVLRLLARGRTNRQIGAELYMSEKTASVHVSRILAKLGAGGRTEAVALAAARGLLTPTPG